MLMTLPAYDERGFLPPGIHIATWQEITARFGGTSARDALLEGLRDALALLTVVGCRQAWIDGSFVSNIETRAGRPPGDIDVCWDLAGVDIARLATVVPELHPLIGNLAARRRRFGGDYFPVTEPITIGQVEAFQFTRDGERKGIVLLILEGGAL